MSSGGVGGCEAAVGRGADIDDDEDDDNDALEAGLGARFGDEVGSGVTRSEERRRSGFSAISALDSE